MKRIFISCFLLTLLSLCGFSCGSGDSRDTAPEWSGKNLVHERSGEIFFPFGIYYVSHYSEQKGRRLADLEKIASIGLNLIHTPLDRSDRAFLDRAHELGVSVVVENNDDDPPALEREFRDHPAIWSWSTFDDVDALDKKSGSLRYLPADVSARSAEMKSVDPDAYTYVSGGNPKRFDLFVHRSDLIAFQTYPVPDEPLSSTFNLLTKAANAIGPEPQGFIANLQTFGWKGKKRYPTPEEIRNMTYQSLIRGVTGIIYYTYFDEVTDLNNRPEIVEILTQLAGEVKRYQPFFTGGRRALLSTGDRETFAGFWESGEEKLLAVVNTRARAVENLTITVPGGQAWQALSGSGETLQERDGIFTGSLSPQAVALFVAR